jgi:hypothetical protein
MEIERPFRFVVAIAALVSAGACSPGAHENIPKDAQSAIRRVHDAAEKSDFSVLSQVMVEEFAWSFGGDRNREQAIEAWRKDADYLKNLRQVTGRECVVTDSEIVECPTNAGTNFRAGFQETKDGWRMIYFVAGD